jgi:hypothetical protein
MDQGICELEALRDFYFVLNNDQETVKSSGVSVIGLLLR